MSLDNSFLNVSQFNLDFYSDLFSITDHLRQHPFQNLKNHQGLFGALVFFEASTRTRMSFEAALVQEGFYPLKLDSKMGSSLEKGETFEDTLLNIAAMGPQFIVVRCGDDLDLELIAEKISMPILNAGWGRVGHPTQALLDVLTMRNHWKKNSDSISCFKGKKLLIVGDITHSRVASSHFTLAKILGYEVAVCGPDHFIPENISVPVFKNLEEGLSWCDAAMALRVQHERHQNLYEMNSYHELFGFHEESLKALKSEGLILHPGPINHGIEFSPKIFKDSRCCVFEQVQSGVLVRQALIRKLISNK